MMTVVCRHCQALLPTGHAWWLVPCPHCAKDPAFPLPDEDEDEPDSDPTGDHVPPEPPEGQR